MKVAKVVFPQVWSEGYDYLCDNTVNIGDIVLVPIRNTNTLGVIFEIFDDSENTSLSDNTNHSLYPHQSVNNHQSSSSISNIKLKHVFKVLHTSLFNSEHISFLITISRFNFTTLGSSLKLFLSTDFIKYLSSSSISTQPNNSTNNNPSSLPVYFIYNNNIYTVESFITKHSQKTLVSQNSKSQLLTVDFLSQAKLDSFTYLTSDQLHAADQITQYIHPISPANSSAKLLLEGATGSGKTEVYLESITRILNQYKNSQPPHGSSTTTSSTTTSLQENSTITQPSSSVDSISYTSHSSSNTSLKILILLPEVSLSYSFIERFIKHFNIPPLVWNHKTSATGKRSILDWACDPSSSGILIGTRSSLFLPFRNLKIIIMDEEHDLSYKQSDSLRYHTKSCIETMSKLYGTKCIYVSATPSFDLLIDSSCLHIKLTRAQQHGHAKIVIADMNYKPSKPVNQNTNLSQTSPRSSSNTTSNHISLPLSPTVIKPTKRELFEQSLLSPLTINYMRETLSRQELSMLFINRKGFASVIMCYSCKLRLVCKYCSVGLVYYKPSSAPSHLDTSLSSQSHNHNTHSALALCHYCGYTKQITDRCSCGNPWTFSGTGIDHIESIVQKLFPDARTCTVSSDIGKQELSDIYKRIYNHDIDIIIGTQMLIQGHHIPHLTFIAILDCDFSLAMPYYNASEHTYQMLTQARGRAGRDILPGTCLLQTYSPHNPMIEHFQHEQLAEWKQLALADRLRYNWPPYCKLLSIIIESTSQAMLKAYTQTIQLQLYTLLKTHTDFTEVTLNSITSVTPPSPSCNTPVSSSSTSTQLNNQSLSTQSPNTIQILGPTPSPINKLKGKHRNRFLIKYNDFEQVHNIIQIWLKKTPTPAKIKLIIDNLPENFT